MPDQSEDMNSLSFQDLVILKQFLEKGFRENLFTKQEIPGMTLQMTKLTNIIQGVLDKANHAAAKEKK